MGYPKDKGDRIGLAKANARKIMNDLGYMEKPMRILVCGAGEMAPKLSYFHCGRSIHRAITKLRKENDLARKRLGIDVIGQPAMFRGLLLDLIDERNALRSAEGLPDEGIDPTPWINPDRLEWADAGIQSLVDQRLANGEYDRILAITAKRKAGMAKMNEKKKKARLMVDEQTGEALI
jgi:hypothetical protein